MVAVAPVVLTTPIALPLMVAPLLPVGRPTTDNPGDGDEDEDEEGEPPDERPPPLVAEALEEQAEAAAVEEALRSFSLWMK